MCQLFQRLLSALPIILPQAGTITVEASRMCDHITVYASKIFHLSIHCVAQEHPYTRTKAKIHCFDSEFGFCKSLPCAVSCNQHTPLHVHDRHNREFTVDGLGGPHSNLGPPT
jgi:hypothetical protein